MRPTSAGARGYGPTAPPGGMTRRPMTAVPSESKADTMVIGRPTLINAAERASILQSQRAAALRRRNVQLRIAKIEAEPVAEWQSSSKALTLHHYAAAQPKIVDDDEAPIKESPSPILSTSKSSSSITTKPTNPARRIVIVTMM